MNQDSNRAGQLLDEIIGLYEPDIDAAEKAALLLASKKRDEFHGAVKNVLLSTTSYIEGSGHFRAVLDIARELRRFGHGVTLLLMEDPSKEVHEEFDVVVEPGIGPIPDKEAYAKLVDKWKSIIEEHDIQAVILNQYLGTQKIWHGLAIRYAEAATGRDYIPVYVKMHNVFTRQEDRSKEYLLRNAPTFGCFDGLIMGNEADAAFWGAYNSRVFIRPLPVDPVVFSCDDIDLSSHDILYLANLNSTKNQVDAIKAIELVIRSIPDARLILAGGNTGPFEPYFKKCKAYLDSREAELSDHVVFAGYLTEDKKARMMAQCSVGISTSRHEGFPISLAELKRAGLPLVVYDLPNCDMCSGGKANGVLSVTVKTPESIAAEIIRVLQDEELHSNLSANAKAHATKILSFDYEAFWERCFSFDSDQIEITPDLQQRVHRVLFNSIHIAMERGNEADALKERNDELGKNVGRLEKDNGSLRKDNEALSERIRQLEEDNESLGKSVGQLEKDNESLGERTRQLEKDNKSLSKRIRQREKRIDDLKASNSYRIGRTMTAPVRAIKRTLKKSKRKPK